MLAVDAPAATGPSVLCPFSFVVIGVDGTRVSVAKGGWL